MAFQIDVFLLMFFLILTLAWLWRHGWLPLQPSTSRQERCAPRCTVCLSHAPQTIVPSVISPPLPRWVQGQFLVLYAPGVR